MRKAIKADERLAFEELFFDGTFYLKRSKGFGHDSNLDMQMIDMGIALFHFALAAKENDLIVAFAQTDPMLISEPDMEYIASYRIK